MSWRSEGPCFVFITGGVVSGIGKGITAASLAALLQARGLRVRVRKLDPYLNQDSGTMSPQQHGEVFVTEDGAETDLDLGHYERFTGIEAHRSDSITTGKIYSELMERERRGDFLGQTVQIIPHVTDAIKQAIMRDSESVDVMICEIGGTVGDIEILSFLEALRQMRQDLGVQRTVFLHLAWVMYLPTVGELKTKTVQHSVYGLQRSGIQPDILVCRSSHALDADIRKKIGLFCSVRFENVIEALDVATIYQVPLRFHGAELDARVCQHLGALQPMPDLTPWKNLVFALENPLQTVRIGILSKYGDLPEAYRSLCEALTHGGLPHQCRVEIGFINAEEMENPALDVASLLASYDGLLVPGGYGKRGTEGMIRGIRYAREHKVPFLGICFGMQLALIETARHLAGLQGANSSELDPETLYPVIALLEEWVQEGVLQTYKEELGLGGTMRLGTYPCVLTEDSRLASIYGGQTIIHERHRHRYEVNETYLGPLRAAGITFSGASPGGHVMECIERADHPWFVGTQFHPELKSRPFVPHPIFVSFIEAALTYAQQR